MHDFGDVTLVYDDDKRIQAHVVVTREIWLLITNKASGWGKLVVLGLLHIAVHGIKIDESEN